MVFEKKFNGGEKIGTSQNIILTKKGESEKTILVAAHYDSVGTYGVDDNVSGVSIILENAMRMIDEHTPYTIHYIFFGDEEMALWGSRYYVKSMSNIEIEETLIPTLEKAKNQKDTVVYFGDAVHLIYGADLGYSWCIERELVKSSYGRKLFNIMGTLDSEIHEVITVSNDKYITSTEIDELFSKLRSKNPRKRVFIFLDNASYQKYEFVHLSSEKHKINIIYLPTYSPNLNLIERLWKFLRKSCLCNKYFMTFKLFCDSLLNCLKMTHNKYFFN